MSLGYAELESLLQLECKCGRKGLLHTSFSILIYIFYHTGSRNQSCHTFLICSDGMKSHRPGQKDHDGNCPYVEIRSCDLASREKDFSQRMNCGDRWKQFPSELQPLYLDGLPLQIPAVNHSPSLCWIHQTPQDSEERPGQGGVCPSLRSPPHFLTFS